MSATLKLNIILKICILSLIVGLCANNVYAQNTDSYTHAMDSAINIANNATDSLLRLEALDYISHNHQNVDSTLKYSHIEVSMASALGDYIRMVAALRIIAWCYYYNYDYKTANIYYFKALDVCDSVQYKKGMGLCYHSIANTMAMMSNFTEADKYDYRALQIFYELNDTSNISEIYRSLGLMYADYQLYNTANEHFSKALELDILQNNTKKIADDYRHFAITTMSRYEDFLQDSLIEKSRNYALKGYKLIKQVGDEFDMMIACQNLMRIYFTYAINKTGYLRQQLMDSSRMFFNIGHRTAQKNGFLEQSYDFKLQEARFAIVDGNFDTAYKMITTVDKMFEHDSSAIFYMDLYLVYYEYFEAIGNNQKAYEYLCKRANLKDEFLSKNFSLYASKSSVQSEFDDMLMQISLDDQKKRIKEMEEYKLQRTINGSAIGLIILLLIFISTIYRGRRHKLQLSKILEQRVEEVETQRNQLEVINMQITESITYAQRIQNSILTQKTTLENIFGPMLLLWKPLEIVSGDFYWGTQIGNRKLFAVVDCTGHGVPGAFMSMLGVRALSDITASASSNIATTTAADILNSMRDNVITSLHQTEQNSMTLDGMDMAIIILDSDSLELQYAGAFRPLIIIRGEKTIELKADKMPVSFMKIDERPFRNNVINMQKDDVVYMFSDGIPDQFGNKEDGSESKFTTRRLVNLLQTIHEKPFDEQQQIILEEIHQWRTNRGGNFAQTDDIVLCGFRI